MLTATKPTSVRVSLTTIRLRTNRLSRWSIVAIIVRPDSDMGASRPIHRGAEVMGSPESRPGGIAGQGRALRVEHLVAQPEHGRTDHEGAVRRPARARPARRREDG